MLTVYVLDTPAVQIYCRDRDELETFLKFDIDGLGMPGETLEVKITRLQMSQAEWDALPELEL